jgi:hypothetical protein
MTTAEMIETIEGLRDLYKAPYYDPLEYELFINSAIDSFIGSNIPDGKKYTPQSQKSIDRLATLITSLKVTSFTTAGVSDQIDLSIGKFAKPANYAYHYSASAKVNGVRVSAEPQDYDSLNAIEKDAFAKEKVLMVYLGSDIHIVYKSLPQSLNLLYIRNPAKVSVAGNINCDLPESTHLLICHMAVQLSAPGSNLIEMYKIFENENNKK